MKQDMATHGSSGPEGLGMGRKRSARSGKPATARNAGLGSATNGTAKAVKDGTGLDGLAVDGTGSSSQANGKGAATPPADFSVRESHVDPKKAERLRPVMSKLAEQGKGTARALVNAAKKPGSPIHDCFDWDDEVAGNRWRLHQATHYWGAIRIDIETDSGPVRAPAFIPIVVNDERSYRPVSEVAANPDWRAQMMAQATTELKSWQKRYDSLATVAALRGVFKAIQKATKAA